MIKKFIKNRKGKRISTVIEGDGEKGIIFLIHGMGRNKEELCIKTIGESFKENGYVIIKFDTTNTFGESDGDFENTTITNYYEDLEDVINWASAQEWYQEPFLLAGHSIGGLCSMLFAKKFPSKVASIFPISTTISSKLSLELYPQEMLDAWKEKGIFEWQDKDRIKRLKWNFIEDGLKYDILKDIDSINAPIFMIVGENDPESPVKHQKILFDSITGKKELKIIDNAAHLFTEKVHLDKIKNLFDEWISKL
jgi:esterase/lipase